MEERKMFPGELALVIGLLANSFGVSLMVKSGFGISTISSVPYTLNLAIKGLSFGVFNYLFQCTLILILIAITRRFRIGYLLSFGLGILFGNLLDFFAPLMNGLPDGMGFRVIYFCVSFSVLAVGMCMLLKCNLPILPIDTFTRDLTSHFDLPYKRVKTTFDLICLTTTLVLSFAILKRIEGIGIGTIICAFTTGKAVSLVSQWVDQKYYFSPYYYKIKMKKEVLQENEDVTSEKTVV